MHRLFRVPLILFQVSKYREIEDETDKFTKCFCSVVYVVFVIFISKGKVLIDKELTS